MPHDAVTLPGMSGIRRSWAGPGAALLGAAILLVPCGCAERYERVEVVGVVVPVTELLPAPGSHLQPLPPMPDLPQEPDTADGSLLVDVDQRRFLAAHGSTLPAWQPAVTPSAERDPTLASLRQVVEDLRRVQERLDGVFAPTGPGAAAHDAHAATSGSAAANRQAALLLPPGDWAAIVHRIIRVTEAIDHLVSQSQDIGPNGEVVAGLDGEAILARRQNDLWRDLEPLAEHVASDGATLASDGSLAAVRRHPVHGPDLEPLLSDIRQQTSALARTIHERRAPALVADLRLLEHRIDRLEAARVGALAFGQVGPPEPAISTDERNQSRLRLARLRADVVAIATQWAANQSRLLDPQPTPTLVYEGAVSPDAMAPGH